MAIGNINDGVGKKIVDALKMQSDDAADEQIVEEEEEIVEPVIDEPVSFNNDGTSDIDSFSQSSIDNEFNKSLAQNLGSNFMNVSLDDVEFPANVAVLRQLISKLPAGVSKQTGAVIIKQTMEALGISMSSVLKEASQVQETLYNNSKECKNTIADYKKQISVLEAKAMQYQKQAASMNDIISLFLQTK